MRSRQIARLELQIASRSIFEALRCFTDQDQGLATYIYGARIRIFMKSTVDLRDGDLSRSTEFLPWLRNYVTHKQEFLLHEGVGSQGRQRWRPTKIGEERKSLPERERSGEKEKRKEETKEVVDTSYA